MRYPWRTQTLFVAILLLVVTTTGVAVRAAALPGGTVVVARVLPTALLIWDASPAVADLVIAQTPADDALRGLEMDAVRILAARAPRLRAKQVEIHVQYAPTGVVGAAYNASTFASETRLVELSAATAAVKDRSGQWLRDLAAHRAPAGLTVRVVGTLPTNH